MVRTDEKNIIDNKFQLLMKACHGYVNEDEELALQKAYDFTCGILGEIRTYTGELRINHSLSIALIAVEEMGLGTISAISCLLHDALIHDFTSEAEIRKRFGKQVAHIVEGFAKVSALPTDKVSLQSESFTRLFLAIVDDIRIILIKIAHRLYDMQMIDKLPEKQRNKFVNEVNHIYSPIAHRMGLYRIKKEFEERVMKFEHPQVYAQIAQKIQDTESKRNTFIKKFTAPIYKDLDENELSYEMKGRPKSIPSIWNKMENQEVEFEEIFDLFAVRIILNSDEKTEKADCWKVYSLVTNLYTPNPKRLRDWISSPKATGYESLHTTVMGPNKKWVEVQIRSARMDELAEKGQAAHWRYKGFGSKKDSESWLNQVRDILEHPEQIDFDELSSEKKEKKTDRVFVFTPNGDLKELAEGSTVLDFAFDIHTNVGYSCTGAKINNKIVPLRQKLSNGDKVEILTSKVQKPKLDWLNYVYSTKAKNKIKRALKEEKFEEAEKGNEILRRKLRNWKIPFNDSNIDKLIKKYRLSSSVDLYSMIFQQKIDTLDIKRVLTAEEPKTDAPAAQSSDEKPEKEKRRQTGDVLMIDRTLDKVNYNLAKCCNPIPGDSVFGFVTISRGITIHRKRCPNAKQLLDRYGYRAVEVHWKENEDTQSFDTTIKVTGVDKVGMMTEISKVISNDMKVNMQSVQIDSREGVFYGTVRIIVRDTKHLDELLHKLVKIKGVTKAIRVG